MLCDDVEAVLSAWVNIGQYLSQSLYRLTSWGRRVWVLSDISNSTAESKYDTQYQQQGWLQGLVSSHMCSSAWGSTA